MKTAVNDAKALAAVLERDYGYAVELLLDATRADVVMALDRYRTALTSKDNLLIY
ncbi:MAG: caspase family protein [Alphaproteobacteria bacterium]|nr:caspase family protein [Alphaproteobacteria bacterium]